MKSLTTIERKRGGRWEGHLVRMGNKKYIDLQNFVSEVLRELTSWKSGRKY
jgi:hypothetical protein